MAILGQEKNSTFSQKGISPNNIPGLQSSKVHNQYSINGNPNLVNKPTPSKLDPEKINKYLDHLPK
jgi:hypothetical protein